MNAVTTVITSVVGGVLSGGGGVAIIKAIASRRVTKVDAADRLSDGALRWVEQFQEDAHQAQVDAKEARTEASAARREAATARAEASEALTQMRNIRAEAQWLATQLQDLRRAILDPGVTIERLRAMVGPQNNNGTGN